MTLAIWPPRGAVVVVVSPAEAPITGLRVDEPTVMGVRGLTAGKEDVGSGEWTWRRLCRGEGELGDDACGEGVFGPL